MQRCLELASLALKNGDAPVGSIIVRSGEIIAEAFESVRSKIDPTAHAVIDAIRSACEKVGDAPAFRIILTHKKPTP